MPMNRALYPADWDAIAQRQPDSSVFGGTWYEP